MCMEALVGVIVLIYSKTKRSAMSKLSFVIGYNWLTFYYNVPIEAKPDITVKMAKILLICANFKLLSGTTSLSVINLTVMCEI